MKRQIPILCLIAILIIVSSCQSGKNSDVAIVQTIEQKKFNAVLQAIFDYNNSNAIKEQEYFDSAFSNLEKFGDTSIILNWVGIVKDMSIELDSSSSDGTFITSNIKISEGTPSNTVTLNSDNLVPEDVAQNNFYYNQLKKYNLKIGDTVRFDGIFKLNNIRERKLKSVRGTYKTKLDLNTPSFDIQITSIRPFRNEERVQLSDAKRLTRETYLVGRNMTSQVKTDSEGTRQRLIHADRFFEDSLTTDEQAEVKHLARQRLARELLLINN